MFVLEFLIAINLHVYSITKEVVLLYPSVLLSCLRKKIRNYFFCRWYGYHNEQKHLPIFEKGKISYTKQEVATILLDQELLEQSGKICTTQPGNISASMSFVIDLEMLEDVKDLTADYMCAYRSYGSPPKYIYVQFEDKRVKHMVCNRKNRLVDEEIERLGLNDAYVFILERKYGKCKASQNLRRMTVELKMVDNKRNKHFISHDYCLVQYTFNKEDQYVHIVPHGNSKTTSKP